MKAGTTYQLNYRIIPTNATNKQVTWETNDNRIVNITDDEPITYIINIKKQNYTIYFIGIISVLLIINIIRIIVNKKKKRSK